MGISTYHMVSLVESKHGGLQIETAETRLDLVLMLLDSGALAPNNRMGYGAEEHKAALDKVEAEIARIRAYIAEKEAQESDGPEGETS